ncbi:MAG: hypothetical protein ACXAEF_00515 [Candidatus Thorarchaeota archaeon]
MEKENEETKMRGCEEVISDPSRGKLIVGFSRILRKPLLFLRILGPFLTAHHPICTPFHGHVFRFRGRNWCIGCFTNSLSFLTAVILLFALWFIEPSTIDRRILFYGGISGMILYLVVNVTRLPKHQTINVILKTILGVAFAAFGFSVLIAGDSIMYLLPEKVALLIMLYMFVIMLLNGKRAWETFRTCKECEYKMRWSKCPGFKDMICNLIESGYVYPKPVADTSK